MSDYLCKIDALPVPVLIEFESRTLWSRLLEQRHRKPVVDEGSEDLTFISSLNTLNSLTLFCNSTVTICFMTDWYKRMYLLFIFHWWCYSVCMTVRLLVCDQSLRHTHTHIHLLKSCFVYLVCYINEFNISFSCSTTVCLQREVIDWLIDWSIDWILCLSPALVSHGTYGWETAA